MSNVFSIAISGMNAAATRVANATKNIVNVSSTGKLPTTPEEKTTAHMPTDVVTLSNSVGDHNLGVSAQVVPRDPAYRPAYAPGNPDANENGLVAEPNVDVTKELVDIMMAELAYKASVKVIKAEKENQQSLIDTIS